MSRRLRILLLSPYPLEETANPATAQLSALAAALRRLGHRALLLAPTLDGERAAGERQAILAGEVGWARRTVAVGQAVGRGQLAPLSTRGGAELVERLAADLQPDVLHLLDPLPGSLSAAALRRCPQLMVVSPSPLLAGAPLAVRAAEGTLQRADGLIAPAAALARLLPGPPGRPTALLPPALPLWTQLPRQRRNQLLLVERDRAARRTAARALRRLRLEPQLALLVAGATEPSPRLAKGRPLPLGEAAEREAARSRAVVVGGDEDVPYALAGLAGGAVVVAPSTPLFRELLGGGERGLLYPEGDGKGLAEAIAAALGGAAEERAAAGAALAATLTWERAAAGHARFYLRLLSRRKPLLPPPAGRALVELDLHMHTNHSHDCATPAATLLERAREVGLDVIAVTDHNEVSGALEAASLAPRYGVEVIVGEEIKTAGEGEVIGLFIAERIPPGLTLRETIEAIKEQGGVVYVPHPFDRLHSVPDYRHLLEVVELIDAIEVYNARVAFAAYNAEAARFAARYRLPGGAGSDAHVPEGLGSARVRMPAFSGPRQFLRALAAGTVVSKPRSLLYVQALKFLRTTVGRSG